MVVKYKRQVRSDSIGVIRADMSVANSLAETANAIGRMSNEAFKIAAVKSEEKPFCNWSIMFFSIFHSLCVGLYI